jgi:predicted acetyltransferase
MPTTPGSGFPVEVVAAPPEQSVVVANLFELYAHDFSEFHDVEPGEDGRFGFSKLPLYWSDPKRRAFLIQCRGKLAGFALVKQGSEVTEDDSVWDMAEFFVLRRYRRDGVGTEAARQIWTRYPGRWEVRVMEANKAAQAFWTRAIESVLDRAITPLRVRIADRDWLVFALDSAPGR